ncbi:MATE family efflux transporter [Persephonella sp.]
MKRKILQIALPAVLNNLLDTLQLLIDMLMIGRISPSAIAAVGLGGQLLILLYGIIGAFHVGTNVLVARYYGSKNLKEARKTTFSMTAVSAVTSLPFAVITYLFNSYYFSLMSSSPEVIKLGTEYITPIALSIPFLFIGTVMYATFHAYGDTKTPLIISIFTNSLNTVLNYILIFGKLGAPELGVKGAGIATAVSYTIEVLIFVYFIFKKNMILLNFSSTAIKKGLKIGIPAGIEKTFSFLSFLAFVKVVSEFGEKTLAGYQIGLRIEAVAFMPGFGFAAAVMVLVGQYLGAGKPEKAEQSVKETLKIGSAVMGSIGVILFLVPEYFVKLFTNNEEVIQEASLYLRIIGLSQIPLAFEFILNGALKGAGATKETLVINNISFWLFRVIPAYTAGKITGDIAVVYIIVFAETTIKALILWYYFRKGKWKKIKI